jgi:hypothetical protein
MTFEGKPVPYEVPYPATQPTQLPDAPEESPAPPIPEREAEPEKVPAHRSEEWIGIH